MKEEWRQVVGYEGQYMVSNFGAVCSSTSWNVLKQTVNQTGGLRVSLFQDGHASQRLVPRVVMEAFGEIPKGCFVVHFNGDKRNNHLDNLRVINKNHNKTRLRALEAAKRLHPEAGFFVTVSIGEGRQQFALAGFYDTLEDVLGTDVFYQNRFPGVPFKLHLWRVFDTQKVELNAVRTARAEWYTSILKRPNLKNDLTP